MTNRAENGHRPFQQGERTMLRFRGIKTLLKFASVQANAHYHLDSPRSGSILSATSSNAKPTSNAAQQYSPGGRRPQAECPNQSPIPIVERRGRTRPTAPSALMPPKMCLVASRQTNQSLNAVGRQCCHPYVTVVNRPPIMAVHDTKSTIDCVHL